MLSRRTFLKATAALLVSPVFVRADDAYRHPYFGKYIGHSLKRHVDWQSFGELGSKYYFRYVTFPIEVVLEAEFEKATIKWVNFNSSENLVGRLEIMSPHKLFAGIDWSEGKLTFPDEVSAVWELDQYRCRPYWMPTGRTTHIVPGKTSHFSMMEVWDRRAIA